MKILVRDSENFKKILMMNGYTLRSLAKKIGSSGGYLSQIVSGERNPGPAIAKKIVDEIGVEFEEIFFIENVCNSNHQHT
jgi:transcriptional regulator with XRE-family HTH domain